MTTRFLNAAFLVGALGAFALSASAQSAVARATVPFEFAAGGAMMPPGEYIIEISEISGSLLVRGPAGSAAALITLPADGTSSPNQTKLVFERRDGMAYLAGVAWPGQGVRVASPFVRISKGAPSVASLH